MSRLRLPLSKCYGCGAPLDDRTEITEDDGSPATSPAVSVCLYCGAVGVFGEDLRLSRPTRAVLTGIFEDPAFRQVWAQMMLGRVYLMAEGEPRVRYLKERDVGAN